MNWGAVTKMKNPTIKKVTLSDGRGVIIKEPAIEEDLQRLVDFLSSLPPEMKNYLRYNVTQADVCRRRLEQLDSKNHWRLIAELDGEIVGDTTLDREPFGWTRHVAELRGIVSPNIRGMGIGSLLRNQIVGQARLAGVERLVAEVLREQTDLIEALEKAGFQYEATRRKYAKDLRGTLHDVIIMSNDLEQVWKRLAEDWVDMDIKPHSRGI
jgi:RimJ/RimL family protein N-acetyltransferase